MKLGRILCVAALLGALLFAAPVQADCGCGRQRLIGNGRVLSAVRRVLPSIQYFEGGSISWGPLRIGGAYQFNFNNGQPMLQVQNYSGRNYGSTYYAPTYSTGPVPVYGSCSNCAR